MAPKRKSGSKALDGKVVCITGRLSVSRAKFQCLIEDNGGTFSGTVTRKVNLVVYGPDGKGTDKYTEAEDKDIKLVTEDDFRKLLDGGDDEPPAKKRKVDSGSEDDKPAPKRAAAKRGKKAASASDEEEEKPKPKRGKAAKKAASDSEEETKPAPKKRGAKDDSGDEKETKATENKVNASEKTEKVIKKGRGVVDKDSPYTATHHVFDDGTCVWQCTLNQTNVGSNNNKFYIIQILQSDSNGSFVVWNRWARVGLVGQSAAEPCSNLDAAKRSFCKKFKDKTKNDWSQRDSFVKHAGKYHLMEMDYGDEEEEKKPGAQKPASNTQIPESKLAPSVQEFIKLISNVKMMENTMKELNIDVKRMPLGKISKKQVLQAYQILKDIDAAIKQNKGRATLVELTGNYYTLIPHDFGMRQPPVITDNDMLQKETTLLDTLVDLEIASKLLSEGENAKVNPIDANYGKLNCGITPLDKSSATYKLLCEYVKNTHGETHKNYELAVEDIFEVDRGNEADRIGKYKEMDNRQLLWHGSRLTNWMGILSQGLRIAPPEAPVTGYMFGKGVYFADMVTKSANYCCTSRSANTGVMILCEVPLGKMYTCKGACYMDEPRPGYNSTMGVGKMMPDPTSSKQLENMIVPCGKPCKPAEAADSSLLYNEFIVYDEAQVRVRYLFRMKFNYK